MSEKPTYVLNGYLMLVVGIVLFAVTGVMLYSSYGSTGVAVLIVALFSFMGLSSGVSEKSTNVMSSYLILAMGFVGAAAGGILYYSNTQNGLNAFLLIALLLVALLLFAGLFIVNPNDAKVMVLLGSYAGTARTNGFFWANPFFVKRKLSLRARNLSGQKLKVNDKLGNPIEIATVVVWQVNDTFKASFEVDDYEQYVVIQSETAVRHLAQSYPYDSFQDEGQDEGLTLRSGADQVNRLLEGELQNRLDRAGVKVIEARLTHLAYAPEIAEAMLRRQQASAVVSARTTIVRGAVSMVEMALNQLSERHLVDLDEDRRAAMVSNLLVVLCSETAASPVINAGTLYQ